MYKGFLIDLDGVAYLGKQVITSCLEFTKELTKNNIKYCFVTNNSTRTHVELLNHLNSMGYEATSQNIITSSDVTSDYIKTEKSDARVYFIGMNGL